MARARSPVESDASLADVWNWLEEVPDPEIPVVSVVDLGIVRDVRWQGSTLHVTITPTYSGCPATQTIAGDIERCLRDRGVAEMRVSTRLAPPWTTDWLSEKGRRALRAYGIAPPARRVVDISGLSRRQPPAPTECPQCGSREVTRISQFGSTPCKALYRCAACSEPFDYFKPL